MQRVVERDLKIDILRCVAIVGIIIAHSEPNKIIFQLRNFDVILMVLILGASFYLSSNRSSKKISYVTYSIKRMKRLIIPTWIFLTIFFSLFLLISLELKVDYYFSFKEIFMSYIMINGIGYVWIMRVFFLIALISPILLKLNLKIKNNNHYFLILFLIYGIYIIFQLIYNTLDGPLKVLFENFVLYGIGYGLIAAFGMRLKFLSNKEIYLWTIFFLVLFLGFMWYYQFSPTQNYKYPPQLYYISYGMFISLFLYIVLDVKVIRSICSNKLVMFISQNSIWLYFWHIIFIYLLKFSDKEIQPLFNNFIARFAFIFTLALVVTYIHSILKKVVYNFKKRVVIEKSI